MQKSAFQKNQIKPLTSIRSLPKQHNSLLTHNKSLCIGKKQYWNSQSLMRELLSMCIHYLQKFDIVYTQITYIHKDTDMIHLAAVVSIAS
jgi:hypothetical protein